MSGGENNITNKIIMSITYNTCDMVIVKVDNISGFNRLNSFGI